MKFAVFFILISRFCSIFAVVKIPKLPNSCVQVLIRNYINLNNEKEHRNRLVILEKSKLLIEDNLLSNENETIQIFTSLRELEKEQQNIRSKNILILSNNVAAIENILSFQFMLYPDIRVLIILKRKTATNSRYAADYIGKIAWKIGITKLMTVIDDKSGMQLFVWNRTKPRYCRNVMQTVHLIHKCTEQNVGSNVLQNKLKKIMRKRKHVHHSSGQCKVPIIICNVEPHVIVHDHPDKSSKLYDDVDGIEVRLVKEAGKILKFHPEFYEPPNGGEWGTLFSNGSGTGLTGELLSGNAEIGIGAIMPLPERAQAFSISVSYSHSYLSWAVPKPRPKQFWASLLAPFTFSTWIVFTLSFIVLVISALLIVKSKSLSGGVFLFLWGTMLGVSFPHHPEVTWQRIILASWLVACLVLSTSYQGSLFSELASPQLQKAPDSLNEILEAGIPIGGHPGFISLLDGGGDNHTANTAKKLYNTLLHVLPVLHQVARGERDVALVVNKGMLLWYNAKHRLDGQTVHIAKEDIASYQVASFLRKNSQLTTKYNKIVRIITEAGFLTKWYRDFEETPWVKDKGDGPKALSLKQLAVSFFCLGIGLTLAAIVLLLELVTSMLKITRFYYV